MLGRDANRQERKAAMKTAEEFLEKMHYSTNTQVCVEMNWLEKMFLNMGAHDIATKLMKEFGSK